MFTVTLDKAKYIEGYKDAIKKAPFYKCIFLCNLLIKITPLYL